MLFLSFVGLHVSHLGIETFKKNYLPHFSARIVLFELKICITSACLLDFAFVTIMTSQYWVRTSGDHESSCIHDRCARKEEISRRIKLEDPIFDCYHDPSIFRDWLADMECYFDLYGFSEATRVLFARRKLVQSARVYWDLIVRACVRRGLP